MDISALSEENFNAVEWVNANYRKYLEDTETEGTDVALQFIQSYVSKLSLYVQQVNYAVEESSQSVVANMPRIVKEAVVLQNEVQQLQQRTKAMRKEMSAVQAETGDCMAMLDRLNTLQIKLQVAKESLQESDGWGNLLVALEDCFERNDLKGVCVKLVALQKSLQAQEQLPSHSERQAQVEDFKNRLEALASPSVVDCFAQSNLEQAKRYLQIFAAIERLPQFYQYYRAVQKNSLQQQWKQTLELQSTDINTSTQQKHVLTLYYDSLLEHSQRQLKWCTELFSDDSNESGKVQPFLVIAELLPGLQPTRDAHILQVLKTSNERLDLLAQYSLANHSFVLHLNSLITQSNIILTRDILQQLGDAVYEYFYKFIQQYPRLEETLLSTQVDRLIVNHATLSDAVRYASESTKKLFSYLNEACERCERITNDLGLCKLITLLNSIFKRQLENFRKTQRQISLGGIEEASSENWSMLQYTMSLLQSLADFQIKLHKFEQTLHSRMAQLYERLKNSTKSKEINIYSSYENLALQKLMNTLTDYHQKRAEVNESSLDTLGIFPEVYSALKTHFYETHQITLGILLQPIELQLTHIQPPDDAFSSLTTNMPAFSFAPQEYITQIGQYLLTLPQHLEPLLLAPSPALKQALELSNLKYSQADVLCADILLSLVVEQCCVLYQSQILQIKSLTMEAATQLSVDIEYLSNVLEELGLSINLHLSQILTLLKASGENYLTLSIGCEPRLVTAIRQMRNILSTQ